jgi:hypothetical protein
MNTTISATLPSGGAILDDVYGHYPSWAGAAWLKSSCLANLTQNWKKRS